MKLTRDFSRVAGESFYGGPSEARQKWMSYNMPEPFEYMDIPYYFTGKMGHRIDTNQIVFEYSDYGEDEENRLWLSPDLQVFPD